MVNFVYMLVTGMEGIGFIKKRNYKRRIHRQKLFTSKDIWIELGNRFKKSMQKVVEEYELRK